MSKPEAEKQLRLIMGWLSLNVNRRQAADVARTIEDLLNFIREL